MCGGVLFWRGKEEMRDGAIPASSSTSGCSTQGYLASISYIRFHFILFLHMWTQPSGLGPVGTQWRSGSLLWAHPNIYTFISVELFLSPKHVHLLVSSILIKPGKKKMKYLNNGPIPLYRWYFLSGPCQTQRFSSQLWVKVRIRHLKTTCKIH